MGCKGSNSITTLYGTCRFLITKLMRRANQHKKTETTCIQCKNKFMARSDKLKEGVGKYCSYSCSSKFSNSLRLQHLKGDKNPNWKGGVSRYKNKHGYIVIRHVGNEMSGMGGYMLEHRLVMSMFIGRKLYRNESVHHKNGIRDDNRIENLELWVKPQVSGQRVTDLVAFAKEILNTYADIKIP